MIAMLALAAVLASLLFAHAEPLAGMVARWENSPMYSFGYIVPVISAYLLWTRRDELGRLDSPPSPWLGGLTVSCGLAMLVTGQLGGIQVLAQFAFLVCLVGAVLVVFGLAWFRKTWVAFAYLLLMIPFWDAFTEPLHWPFQQLSAQVGIRVLQALGIPAYGEGVFIVLPDITLEVARACSGVNYLVAVLALGVPLAYLHLPTMGRRLLLIASAVVVAAFSNSLRVALIGALAYVDIGSPLHGPAHVLHGLFVSGIGYVVLFLGLRLLVPSATSEGRSTIAPEAAGLAWFTTIPLGYTALLSVLFLVSSGFLASRVPTAVPLVSPLDSLPTRLGSWVARGEGSAPEFWRDADSMLVRRYTATGTPVADVYMGYYASQTQGKEMVSHQEGAWYRASSRHVVPLRGGRFMTVNLAHVTSGRTSRLVMFWYDVDGTLTPSQAFAKAVTLKNSVLRRRTNGTVVVVSTELADDTDRDTYIQAMTDLASHLQAAFVPLCCGQAMVDPAPSHS